MAFTYITVTGQWFDSSGNQLGGTVIATPTVPFTNGGVTISSPVVVAISGGITNLVLAATNDPGTSPSTAQWDIEVRFNTGAIKNLNVPISNAINPISFDQLSLPPPSSTAISAWPRPGYRESY
jgi:hypothetical protein